MTTKIIILNHDIEMALGTEKIKKNYLIAQSFL